MDQPSAPDDAAAAPVQCATCGFLEAGDVIHGNGRPATMREREDGSVGLHFRCFRQAQPIHEELRAELSKPSSNGVPYQVAALEVIRRDRWCDRWFKFEPGSSLKDHLDWLHMLQLDEARREHELRLAGMEAESRKSAEKIQADSLEIAKALKTTTEATGRFNTKWTRIAVAIAVAALLAAGTAAVFEALTYFKP